MPAVEAVYSVLLCPVPILPTVNVNGRATHTMLRNGCLAVFVLDSKKNQKPILAIEEVRGVWKKRGGSFEAVFETDKPHEVGFICAKLRIAG